MLKWIGRWRAEGGTASGDTVTAVNIGRTFIVVVLNKNKFSRRKEKKLTKSSRRVLKTCLELLMLMIVLLLDAH